MEMCLCIYNIHFVCKCHVKLTSTYKPLLSIAVYTVLYIEIILVNVLVFMCFG